MYLVWVLRPRAALVSDPGENPLAFLALKDLAEELPLVFGLGDLGKRHAVAAMSFCVGAPSSGARDIAP